MRNRTARSVGALLLLLFLLIPLAGCGGPGSPVGFGSSVPVPDNPSQALREGTAKESAARAKKDANEPQEATRLYQSAAQYYGSVAGKYRGSETGLRALMAQARLLETGANNLPAAQQTLRTALKQYPATAFPSLHEEVQRQYEQLIQRMDEENSHTPYYQAMDALVRLMGGSPVLAIFFISIGVTLALWPLRAKQYRGMKEMQRHQPEMKKIQEKYKDDRALQQEKVMEFYKEHGFNPMAGCLPMLAQMPILWLLYHAISLYQFQFTKHTFLWMNPAAAQASQVWPAPLTGAIARNLGEQDLLLLFVYAVSMYFQTKLTPASDPSQAEQQKIMAVVMPVMFFVMMLQWHLPAAFVLYWFLSNILMVTQQWWINRHITMPPLAVATVNGEPGNGGGSGVVVPGNGSAAAAANGDGRSAKPLTPNQKLISPKNRKNKKR